jgi:hypothetical protein
MNPLSPCYIRLLDIFKGFNFPPHPLKSLVMRSTACFIFSQISSRESSLPPFTSTAIPRYAQGPPTGKNS